MGSSTSDSELKARHRAMWAIGRLRVDGRDLPRAARTTTLEWVEADAEDLPFADESFDVVMSAIGAKFAPLNRFCDEWNRGTPDDARFEMEYLLAVGERA